jgi:hypothetical protein
LELLENACLIRIESTLWTPNAKRPKNRSDTCWWISNLTHPPINKFLETYVATAMFISSPPKLKRTVLVSSPDRSLASSLEENNLNIISILPDRMQLVSPSGETTPWEHRLSVTFQKDMLSWRCISHRAMVLILAIRVSTSTEKIIGLSKYKASIHRSCEMGESTQRRAYHPSLC